MKKILLVCAGIVVLVSSCSKEDPTVVGAWRCTHSYVYHAYETTVYQDETNGWVDNVLKFTEDGLYYENGEKKGTYFVQNDSLFFNKTASNAEFNYEYAIVDLHKSTLRFSFIVEDYNMRLETTYEFKAY